MNLETKIVEMQQRRAPYFSAKGLKLEIVSNSYLPLALTGADWEGNYVVRTVGRR